MKRLVVGSLELFCTIFAIGLLVVGTVYGYDIGINTKIGGIGGALIGLLMAFGVSVLTFGAIFTLLEINESLRDIRRLLTGRRSEPERAPQPDAGPATPRVPSRPSSAPSRDRFPFFVKIGGVTIRHNYIEYMVFDRTFTTMEEAQAFAKSSPQYRDESR